MDIQLCEVELTLEDNDSDSFVCYGTDSEYHTETSLSSDSSMNDNSSPKNIVQTRKRNRNSNSWKRVKSKRQKNVGEAYENAVGREVSAKVMKSGCTEKCRLRCRERVPQRVRNSVFNFYYKLGNKERQWDFIAKSVQVIDKKVTKICSGESRRNSSRLYHLISPEEKNITANRVCLKMFLDTLAISNQVVDTAISKAGDGGNDNRGKYVRPVNELKEISKKHVIRHITSFPTVESHYLRAQTTKMYLESGLSIAKMYRMYLQWVIENNLNTQYVTERQYRDIFNFKFNYGFFKPKKDQCNDCTSYANMSASDKDKFKVSNTRHVANKNEARRLKNIDKATAIIHKNIITVCFDFQKVLQCPFGETNIFFYKRKLNLHNFTVYNLASHQGHCYLWDETIASQGASEAGSCLFKFMLEEKNKHDVRKFIFWTDNCPGQNKNKILFSFYSWASNRLKVDISHKFFEKGHTQNEGDSVHSNIEKSRKNKTVYVPAQYHSLIRNAKVSGSSYNVHEIEQTDIFNFKKLSDSNFFTKNTQNEVIYISKIREISISKNEPNKILYKYEFDENFKEIILYFETTSTSKRPGRKRKPVNRDIIDLLYAENKPISDSKYTDLMYLCEKKYIPGLYKPYYQNLPHTNNINEDSDD